MPKIKLTYTDETSIPPELKQYKLPNENAVEIWAGDNVAEETNAPLVKNRDDLRAEKETYKTKYETLLQSSSSTDKDVSDLKLQLQEATTKQIPETDLAIVKIVKEVAPQITPENLKIQLEKYPTLETRVQEIDTREKNEKVFAASGYKNKEVFLDLLGNPQKTKDVEFVVEPVKEGTAEPKDKVFANFKNAQGVTEKVELSKWVEQNEQWKPYLSVLNTGEQGNGTQWLPQSRAGGGTSTDGTINKTVQTKVDEHNTKVKNFNNPLLPNQQPPQIQQPATGQQQQT